MRGKRGPLYFSFTDAGVLVDVGVDHGTFAYVAPHCYHGTLRLDDKVNEDTTGGHDVIGLALYVKDDLHSEHESDSESKSP